MSSLTVVISSFAGAISSLHVSTGSDSCPTTTLSSGMLSSPVTTRSSISGASDVVVPSLSTPDTFVEAVSVASSLPGGISVSQYSPLTHSS
jgi:hypothetical protein